MKKMLPLILLLVSCGRTPQDTIVKMHTIDHNGMSETIATPERLDRYQKTDFSASQPFAKVMLVYETDTSRILSYYPNGQVHQWLDLSQGRPLGYYREWHANGKPKLLVPIMGGNPDIDPASLKTYIFDELAQVWDQDGNLTAEIAYSRGTLVDTSRYYHQDGTIAKEVPFNHGQINGELREYDLDGNLIATALYREGRQEGEAKGPGYKEAYYQDLLQMGEYDHEEAEITQGEGTRYIKTPEGYELHDYHQGRIVGKVRQYENDQLIHSYHIKNGVKHGEEITYATSPFQEESTPKFSLHWYDGEIHGLVKTWYSNGQIESQREMNRNQKEGLTLAWYPNGQLMLLEEYSQDQLIKGEYFSKESQTPKSTVADGKGIATLFDTDGHPYRKIDYFDGHPNG